MARIGGSATGSSILVAGIDRGGEKVELQFMRDRSILEERIGGLMYN